MIVLGLDLQPTRLGWAILSGAPGPASEIDCLSAGVILLGLDVSIEAAALRAFDCRRHLRQLLDQHGLPDIVAYEIVRRHLGIAAAHGWGAQEVAVKEVVYLAGRDRGQPAQFLPVEVAHGKIALGGGGRATKAVMAKAAQTLWPGWPWSAQDCDAADAAGVALAVINPIQRRRKLPKWRPDVEK